MNKLIEQFEGCKLESYKCPAGIWTIGYGNTYYEDGSKVKEGDVITQDKAEALVNMVCNNMKLPEGLSGNQKTALESLIYNIGQSAFDKSSLKKAILNKDIKGIYNNWDWISAGGKALRGLALRRATELSLFMSDNI